MYRVLIACDKFKGSATAAQVSEAIARGISSVRADARVTTLPVADGGDGTVDAALAAGFAEYFCHVSGPYGEPRRARLAFRRADHTAVVEVAEACGIAGIDPARLRSGQLDATRASTFGVGQLVLAALDLGARTIMLGLGGSATSDAGAGMLLALGAEARDSVGTLLRPDALPVGEVRGIDLSGLDPRLGEAEVLVACDVTNPLTGPAGAAAVYGPQKGVPAARVARLDADLQHFASLVESQLGVPDGACAGAPGAGAAGGLGFASLAVLGGTMRPGIELVLDLAGFDHAVAGVDLVVTGEGRLDEQTLSGKAPAGVARRAKNLPVVVVCGSSDLPRERALAAGFVDVLQLTEVEPDVARCIADPEPMLETLGATIGSRLAEWVAPSRTR